jgi:hypothetical protein
MAVAPLSNLSVSVYLPGSTGPISEHSLGRAEQLRIDRGQLCRRGEPSGAVDAHVMEPAVGGRGRHAAVAGSDDARRWSRWATSITDGYGSTVDANRRWPNVLAQRLLHRRMNVAVLNQGISGNRVLHERFAAHLRRERAGPASIATSWPTRRCATWW